MDAHGHPHPQALLNIVDTGLNVHVFPGQQDNAAHNKEQQREQGGYNQLTDGRKISRDSERHKQQPQKNTGEPQQRMYPVHAHPHRTVRGSGCLRGMPNQYGV